MHYGLTSPLTKQAKRPCLLCHHHLARQVLQGQYLVKCKNTRSPVLTGHPGFGQNVTISFSESSLQLSSVLTKTGTLPAPPCAKPARGKGLETQGPARRALEPTFAICGASCKAQLWRSVAGLGQVVRPISTSIVYLSPDTICNETSRQKQLYLQLIQRGSQMREA